MLEIGNRVVLTYPTDNHVLFPPVFAVREIRIRDIRDLVEQPLTIEEYLRRPWVRRTRWLVRGTDECTGEFRNFYIGASKEFEAPATMKVGFYEPESVRPYKVLPRVFEPTREDRRVLYRAIRELKRKDLGDLKVCLFADDMRVFNRMVG